VALDRSCDAMMSVSMEADTDPEVPKTAPPARCIGLPDEVRAAKALRITASFGDGAEASPRVVGYDARMERIVTVFESHESAERADRAALAAMSPQARFDMLLQIIRRYREGLGEPAIRFERVCRVSALPAR